MLEVGKIYKYISFNGLFERGAIVTVMDCELRLDKHTTINPIYKIKILVDNKITTLLANYIDILGFEEIC